MKYLNIFFILLFVFSAALQYNDPDPYVWIPIYLYGAFICYRAIQHKYNPILYITGLVVYGGYAVYLIFDKTGVLSWINEHNSESIVQSMKATKPWIEETREFFGLMLLIIALVVNIILLKRKKIKGSALQ